MKKIFIIDGGAGRVISAIPALKKYIRNNPDHDVLISVYGWDAMYWSIPELQDRLITPEVKGTFKNFFYDADEVITPEPYKLPSYFRQEKMLYEAFDEIINNTEDHSDLEPPVLSINENEKKIAKQTISDALQQGKQKTILIQPFGQATEIYPDGSIVDTSSRSLKPEVYLKLVKLLSEKYNLVLMCHEQFYLKEDIYTYKVNVNTRGLVHLVHAADYFVGCDSVGQHIARGLNKPGTVIFGSTFPENTSYPDFFQIIENQKHKVYSPIRLVSTDCNFADRTNENSMDYEDDEIINIAYAITSHLESNINKQA